MSFQAPISVSDVISRIRSRRLLLPAIQREFVWEPYKVEWLFDSLLQGYQIGSFLFWEVRDQSAKSGYRYYEVLKEYRERYQTHNPEFNTKGHIDFDAVLDGQQRLTALFIGLTGTYAYKKPRAWWENSERVLPTLSRPAVCVLCSYLAIRGLHTVLCTLPKPFLNRCTAKPHSRGLVEYELKSPSSSNSRNWSNRTGRPNKKPWTSVMPRSRKTSRSAGSSMPSATTVPPNSSANVATDATTA